MREKALKGQDVLVLLRLYVGPQRPGPDPVIVRRALSYVEKKSWLDTAPPVFLWGLSQKSLAEELGLSTAEMHHIHARCSSSGLLNADYSVQEPSFLNMLLYGLRYFIPVEQGSEVIGIPTLWGHQPIADLLHSPDGGTPVWPSDIGDKRGVSISPIYKTAPLAAREHSRLHLALAAVDLLRIGKRRDQEIAIQIIKSLKAT